MKKCSNFARVDVARLKRRGFPEVIYSPGKTLQQIELIAKRILKAKQPLLITKCGENIYKSLKPRIKGLFYNPLARTIHSKSRNCHNKGLVLIMTAGTADIPVAEEAAVVLEMMGNKPEKIFDVGVAGIHRLLKQQKILRKASVIVVVAGMEGALASVVSGLVSKPVIAVPTSCGYGANFKGLSALLTMINSCSPGVAVVNIDNGFGAGYLAGLINGLS